MSAILRRRYLDPRFVPTVPVELIDGTSWSTGLARQYLLNGNGRDYSDAAANGTFPSGSSLQGSSVGPITAFNGSTQYLTATDTGLPTGDKTISMLFSTTATGSGNYGLFAFGTVASNELVCALYSSGALYVTQYGASYSITGYNDGNVHALSVTNTGNSWATYIDGELKNSGALTTSTLLSGSLTIGKILNLGDYFPGSISNFCVHGRVLSLGEIAQFAAKPFSMFQARSRRTWVSVGSLSPITGSIAETQAAQTISATGATSVAGAITDTQSAQTISATGTVSIAGAIAETQAAQTIAATGATTIAGAISDTQAAQTISATGVTSITGSISDAQAAQTISATGAVSVLGAITASQAPQTISATGVVSEGSIVLLQDNQIMSATGTAASQIWVFRPGRIAYVPADRRRAMPAADIRTAFIPVDVRRTN